jgi:poly-gamma-glutamate capsule biosynthesis protein CapA/YwtB (metallophosphatase superfamily)
MTYGANGMSEVGVQVDLRYCETVIRSTLLTLALVVGAACANSAGAPGRTLTAELPSITPTAAPTPTATPELPPPLTVADIFPPRDLSRYNLDAARIRALVATGDVIPARYTDKTIRELGNDFNYTVAETKHITADADITVINLEAPLVSYCPLTEGGFTFCGQPGFTEALLAAGVDVATLENNHIGNYGAAGIEETRGHLESAGILWADRYSPAIFDVRGMRFGFIAFNAVGEYIDRPAMVAAIEELRSQVDVLSVAFHWGAEYVSVPNISYGIAEDYPPDIGHLAVDAGADLVIGNHPHWVQGIEIYNGKFITYAHGNFIFDQMWSYETRLGVVGKYTFYDTTLIGVEFTPVRIDNYAQPVVLQGQEREDVLDTMRQATEDLANGVKTTPGA